MDGFGARRRTAATAVAVLTVLVLTPISSVLAQSAGDRQYSDPLVTDGGGQSGQQSPSSPNGDGTSTPEPAPAPSPAPDDSSAVATSDAAAVSAEDGATLPHTGAEPLLLGLAGLALAACGALGLALPRRARHARR